MAKLTQEQRDKLDSSEFVYPKERRYPIHDPSHGVAALAFVSKSGTPAEKKKVRADVCAKYPGLNSCKKGAANKRSKYEDPLNSDDEEK